LIRSRFSNWKKLSATALSWQYGETTTLDGKRMQQIIEQKPNGVFFASFRTTAPDGSVHKSKEVGAWGLAGGFLFTITTGWVKNGLGCGQPRTAG